MKKVASIDIGSYTARILIAEAVESPMIFQPLNRDRKYIRLADGFNKEGGLGLDPAAIKQTVKTIGNFVSIIDQYKVDYISAVATGVVRRAMNRKILLDSIYDHTGITVRVISGEEEARLTDLGVSNSLPAAGKRRIIFDLGGGSTEFIFSRGNQREFKSIPLGAMTLSQTFLTVDPPAERMIHELSKTIDMIIGKELPYKTDREKTVIIGTGGTVTTLAAIANQVEAQAISHERLNQTILSRDSIRSIFQELKKMKAIERSQVMGLDKERADVILAGSVAILRILKYFNSPELLVSLSDILEGLIIDHLKENENE